MGSSKRENCIEKQLKRMFLIFTFVFHLNKGGNDQMKKSKGCSSITGPPSVRTGKNQLLQILRLKLQKERS